MIPWHEATEALCHPRPFAGDSATVTGALRCDRCGGVEFEWMGGCGECCEDWLTCTKCSKMANEYENVAATKVRP